MLRNFIKRHKTQRFGNSLISQRRSFSSSPIPEITKKTVFGKSIKGLTIGVPKENDPYESTCALDPKTVEKLTKLGVKVNIESESGRESMFSDKLFSLYNGTITTKEVAYGSDLIFKPLPPPNEDLPLIKQGSAIFCSFRSARSEIIVPLREKKIPIYDINKFCKNILNVYDIAVLKERMHFGLFWRIAAGILNCLKRPVTSYEVSQKEFDNLNIVMLGGHLFVKKNLKEFLISLGAKVTDCKLKDIEKIKEADVVLTHMDFRRNDREFPLSAFQTMKKGSLLVDFHFGDIPQFEHTHPENVREYNGKTILSIDTSRSEVMEENRSMFISSVLFTNLFSVSPNKETFHLYEESVKNSAMICRETFSKGRNPEITEIGLRYPSKLKITPQIRVYMTIAIAILISFGYFAFKIFVSLLRYFGFIEKVA